MLKMVLRSKRWTPFRGEVTEFRSRNEFIVEKYVQGKFIKGDKEVDPWSLSPMRKEEIAVLNLELERPDDADE